MKMRMLNGSILSLAISMLSVGPAHAISIAGWDFSQYLGAGFLTTDGSTGADTLTANYSGLDPSGAGPESAAYGTMFINGSFGSTAVDAFGATPEIVPVAGSLVSNLSGSSIPFDALAQLTAEGQAFANPLGMIAQSPLDMVFKADLTSHPSQGSDWGITFGGKTLSGSSIVGVSISTDGTTYGASTNLTLTDVDTPFSLAFGPITADVLYVRLNLGTANGNPILDNVSLNATLVPEPGVLVLLGAGLAALALRRRSA